MAYVYPNFPTKKSLKEAVASGKEVIVREIGPPGMEKTYKDGTAFIEGPHFPKPHTWHGKAWIKDGKIVKVT